MRFRNPPIVPWLLGQTLCVLAVHATTTAYAAEILVASPSAAFTTPTPAPAPSSFAFGPRLGLIFIAQAAICSFLAVSGLLSYVIFNAIRNLLSPPNFPWRFVSGHVDVYFLNLLVSDLVQAIGCIMDIRWAVIANVTPGHFCTAQGIIKNIGDVGVALSTLAIAVHTSAVLLWEWKPPSRLWPSYLVVFVIWLFISLENGISWKLHHAAGYIENTGLWCWIGAGFLKERILLEYFWMWFTALSNVVLYVPLFLAVRGNLVIRGYRFRWRKVSSQQAWTAPTHAHAVARQMLWYPFAYVVVVLPIAIVRWLAFSGTSVPSAATIFAGILFALSGFINSLLYPATRPALLPTRHRDRSGSGSINRHIRRNSGPGQQDASRTTVSFTLPRTTPLSPDGSKEGGDLKFYSPPSSPSMNGTSPRRLSALDFQYHTREFFEPPGTSLQRGKEDGGVIKIMPSDHSSLFPRHPEP